LSLPSWARASARQSQLQAEIEQQQAIRRKLEERADVMSQVRDPLLWAAFDLQSRVYNIVTRQFLSVHQQSGAAEHKAYAQKLP
jgi:type II secretory pathway pseudopilin PulG